MSGALQAEVVLGSLMDVYRLRQYFLRVARRPIVRLRFERAALPPPLPDHLVRARPTLRDKRIGVVATGGSGAMAPVVGVGRAVEELGVTPSVISLCSGSALFGFPLAARPGTDKTAELTLAVDPLARRGRLQWRDRLGPVSFTRAYDMAASVIREGGRRRAANTAVPDVSHYPGIDDVAAKVRLGGLCPQAC